MRVLQAKRRQAGFVQNLLLPGLILLGLVVAGLAMLSGSAGTDTTADRELMSASIALSQGVKLQGALERATGDGVITRATGEIDLVNTLQASSIMPQAQFPVPPAELLTAASSWRYSQGVLAAENAEASPAQVGTVLADDVMYLPNITARGCAAINFRLFGSPNVLAGGVYLPGGGLVTNASVKAAANMITDANMKKEAREGCVALDGSASNFVYYKVVGVH